MNKSPCFPFYPSDFFGDIKVRIMTGEEQAFYMLLLANIWEYDTQYSIPNDTKIIATLLKISEEKFLSISEKILDCFQQKDNRLISNRLRRERAKQDKYRKAQSIKGKKSAEKRSTTAQPQLNNGSTEAPTGRQPDGNSSKPKPKPKPKKNNKADFVLPDWIPIDTWNAYLKIREQKKAAKTPYALNLIILELQKIKQLHNHNPIDVLNKSIKSGWIDVYPLKTDGGNGNKITPPQKSPYVECPRCHAEVMEGAFIEIDGNQYCVKCERPKIEAKKAYGKLSGMMSGMLKSMPGTA
jgi:uncharacterized protein YdaU (DUF1376 family)